MSEKEGKPSVWRRAGKIAAVIIAVPGFIAFPLDMWSRVEFVANKRWLWDRFLVSSQDWASSVTSILRLDNPWTSTALVLAGAILFSLMVVLERKDRRNWQPQAGNRGPDSAGNRTDQRVIPEAILFDAPPDADLKILLEQENFHPFRYLGIIAELQLSVENLTNKVKYFGPIRWEIDDRFNEDLGGSGIYVEKHALQSRRQPLPGTLSPGEAVKGWLVVVLPHRPSGGIGGFTLTLEDEIGIQYSIRRDQRGSRMKPAER